MVRVESISRKKHLPSGNCVSPGTRLDIKINEGTTNATRDSYPAFDLYERMTHKFGSKAPLDIHDFYNLATIHCLIYEREKLFLKKWCQC